MIDWITLYWLMSNQLFKKQNVHQIQRKRLAIMEMNDWN